MSLNQTKEIGFVNSRNSVLKNTQNIIFQKFTNKLKILCKNPHSRNM